MPRSHPAIAPILSHVHRVDRANHRLGLGSFHEMSDGSARDLAQLWHRNNSSDVEEFLSDGVVPYDPAMRLWPALLPAPYAALDSSERLLADYLGTYLLHHIDRGPVPDWRRLPVDDLPSSWPVIELWCAVTESGVPYVVPYSGNRGFGPITIWHDGHLVHARARHRLDEYSCPSCANPNRRRTYLPPVTWRTPELTGLPRRVPLDPHRGTFHAVFSGSPDRPSRRTVAEVSRLSDWNTWTRYARIVFPATGDWLAAFDQWRSDATGYRHPGTITSTEP